MSNLKPLVFLDVDGVLNAFSYHPKTCGKKSYTDFEVHENIYLHFNLTLSPQMCKDFVLATQDADVKWLTTWCDMAPELVAPLCDFPEYEVVNYRELEFVVVGKTEGVAHELITNGPRPFVWIDDDAANRNQVAFLKKLLDEAGIEMPPRLIIEPDPKRGLTREEINEIDRFIMDQSREMRDGQAIAD